MRSPPGSDTFTLRPVRLVRAAETAAAQAAEPQARVRPAPRSQVRSDEVISVLHLRERDVRALGKDRMVFQHRARTRRDRRLHVVDPEDRMRIAHVDDRGRMQHRRVDRADLQFDHAGVAEFLGERNVVPGEARLAHVDGDRALAFDMRRGSGRPWSRNRASLPVSWRQRRRHSACHCRRRRPPSRRNCRCARSVGAGRLAADRAPSTDRMARLQAARSRARRPRSPAPSRRADRARRSRCRCRSSSRRGGSEARSWRSSAPYRGIAAPTPVRRPACGSRERTMLDKK